MIASEKMKELHPMLCGPPAQKMRDDAWDALIDVVEAAEQAMAGATLIPVQRQNPHGAMMTPDTLWATTVVAGNSITLALHALDAALGEFID